MTGEYGDIQDLFDEPPEDQVSMNAQAAPIKKTPPSTADESLEMLDRWVELGWLRALDHGFAAFVCTVVEESVEENVEEKPTALLPLLAAVLSHQVGRGHVCLDLQQLCAATENTLVLPPDGINVQADHELRPAELFHGLTVDQLIDGIQHSCAVGTADEPEAEPKAPPLVLQGTRLYLRRFWDYEQRIAAGIRRRLSETKAGTADAAANEPLKTALNVLFGPHDNLGTDGSHETVDYQKIACAIAARNRFSVITGGPGTGKTTTVVKLLAALQSVACQSADPDSADPYLRIRLSAPTGKAAARLSESIGGAVDQLPLPELPGSPEKTAIPTQVTTLHRLLGSRPGSRQFRHNQDNPLPLDILVIDEASMVDVDLMASVFAALPEEARLIMLGDKDQLASVDAGAVLGELCQRAAAGHYNPDTAEWLQSVTGYQLPDDLLDPQGQPMDQAVAMLRKSYRFDSRSGIGVLASATNDGKLDSALIRQCREQSFEDVAWLQLNRVSGEPERRLEALAAHAMSGSPDAFHNQGEGRRIQDQPVDPPVGYGHYLRIMTSQKPACTNTAEDRERWDAWAASVLNGFNQFKVLCALRLGPFGVDGLNHDIAVRLHSAGLIARTEGWYAGRPVLVTGNDYNLGLMNGDIGVTLSVPWDQNDAGEPVETLRVAFASSDGSSAVRWISPSRLQSLETVYAMTVHKSQGSEFTHACLVIPDRLSPVLTRELVYTGITRARHWLSLAVSHEGVLKEGVGRGVIRASGLAGLLV